MQDSQQSENSEQKLFVLFKEAIQAEQRAQRLYREAEDLCQEPILRGVLHELYEEEVRHEQTLLEHYNELRKKYGTDAKPIA
jgi:rubrerythrin